MKRMFALLLTLGLVLALTACDQIPGQSGNGNATGGASASSDDGRIRAEDGFAYGFLGDTLRTVFFDFTVNSAYICSEFEGYTPSEGNELLVVDMTVFNYTISSWPMWDTDFQVEWGGEGNEDFALPITYARGDLYPNTGVEPWGDLFPLEFDLGIQETRDGLLVYEVPAGGKDFALYFGEYFDDESSGDLFCVYFTPEKK